MKASYLHRTQVKPGDPLQLLPYILAAWPTTRTDAKRWLKHKATVVNDVSQARFDAPLQPGDWVAVRAGKFAAPETQLPSGLRILHEDATILVVEKPPGLLSIATDKEEKQTAYAKLTAYLRGRGQNERVFVVHRLDRDTSGLLVFAKTPQAKRGLQDGWDHAEKRYITVVEGKPNPPQGTFRSHFDESEGSDPTRRDRFKVRSVKPAPASDKASDRASDKASNKTFGKAQTREAVTHYKTLRSSGHYSLMEVTLETGRRNQIRVHFSEAGCPVVGDGKYDAKGDPLRRLALHATVLRFPHPATGEKMEFKSLPPSGFAALVSEKGGSHAPVRKPQPDAAPNPTAPRPSARSARPAKSGGAARRERDRR